MKQVTLMVPENKYTFFMELIKNLRFVKEVETQKDITKAEILQGIKESIHEVNLIKQGKLKGISAKDLSNKL